MLNNTCMPSSEVVTITIMSSGDPDAGPPRSALSENWNQNIRYL